MKKKGLSALFQPVELTQGEWWKTILAFSFPIIVSYLLQQVYTISDAAAGGCGCQRYVVAHFYLFAVCLWRQRGLLRSHIL